MTCGDFNSSTFHIHRSQKQVAHVSDCDGIRHQLDALKATPAAEVALAVFCAGMITAVGNGGAVQERLMQAEKVLWDGGVVVPPVPRVFAIGRFGVRLAERPYTAKHLTSESLWRRGTRA